MHLLRLDRFFSCLNLALENFCSFVRRTTFFYSVKSRCAKGIDVPARIHSTYSVCRIDRITFEAHFKEMKKNDLVSLWEVGLWQRIRRITSSFFYVTDIIMVYFVKTRLVLLTFMTIAHLLLTRHLKNSVNSSGEVRDSSCLKCLWKVVGLL